MGELDKELCKHVQAASNRKVHTFPRLHPRHLAIRLSNLPTNFGAKFLVCEKRE